MSCFCAYVRKSLTIFLPGCQLTAPMFQPCSEFMTMPWFQPNLLNESQYFSSLKDDTPVTSLPCQWKPPKKRKENTLPHGIGTIWEIYLWEKKKWRLALLDDFDPWPMKYLGTATNNLPTLVLIICVYHSNQQWSRTNECKASWQRLIKSYSWSRFISWKIREIEPKTWQQRSLPLWYGSRQYHLTASLFRLV